MLLQWLTIKTIRSEVDLNKKTTSALLVSDDNSDFSETPKVNIVGVTICPDESTMSESSYEQ